MPDTCPACGSPTRKSNILVLCCLATAFITAVVVVPFCIVPIGEKRMRSVALSNEVSTALEEVRRKISEKAFDIARDRLTLVTDRLRARDRDRKDLEAEIDEARRQLEEGINRYRAKVKASAERELRRLEEREAREKRTPLRGWHESQQKGVAHSTSSEASHGSALSRRPQKLDVGSADGSGAVRQGSTTPTKQAINSSFRLSDILDYPIVGPSRSTWRDGAYTGPRNLATQGYTPGFSLLRLGAGVSGVIRDIWAPIVMAKESFYDRHSQNHILWWDEIDDPNIAPDRDLRNWRLRVWTDCGDVADESCPPPDRLAIDLPYAAIVGGYFQPKPVSTFTICTDYLDCGYLVTGGGSGVVLSLRFPIPFSNGVIVQVGYLAGTRWVPYGAPEDVVYYRVSYQLGSLPPTPYSGFRLKTGRFVGCTAPGRDAVFIDEESGRGAIVFLWLSVYCPTLTCLEANMTFRTDGPNQDWQASATDDLIGVRGCVYFEQGRFLDRQAGCIYTDNRIASDTDDATVGEAYKVFTTDLVYWTNGCLGFMPYYVLPESITPPPGPDRAAVRLGYITALYYQESQR